MFLSPGVAFGRYTVKERIGVGGMAEVWEAEDRSTGRRVAVKIILDAMCDDPKFAERFLREARILARLQHAHILPVFDFGEEKGDAFLVTPLLLGGSLSDRLRHGKGVPREAAIGWLKELASALDFAHKAGVIHRDVKPSNILFDAAAQLYLSDFGLAKALSSRELTTTGATMGTPLYMSPEQIRGEDLDGRTDVYGLGVIAYQLLSGERPFGGDAVATVLHKTLHVMPPPPSSVSPMLSRGVDSVVLRALAKDRRRRYETCNKFVSELDQALEGTPPEWAAISLSAEEAAALYADGDAISADPTLSLPAARRTVSDAGGVSVPRFSSVVPTRGRAGWRVALPLVLLAGLGSAFAFRNRVLHLVAPAATTTAPSPVEAGSAPQLRLLSAKQQLTGLSGALQEYAIAHGRYPPGPWPSAYKALVPAYGTYDAMPSIDPWGQAYRYAVSSDGLTYVLVSPGNDGVYQNPDRVFPRLLGTKCRSANEVVQGDDGVVDLVVCNGRFLTVVDLQAGSPR